VRLGRPIRAVLSGVCWFLAVLSAGLTGAAFLGSGAPCEAGQQTRCEPQTWLVIGGVLLTLAFGVVAARLYRPRSKPRTRYPWEYRD